MIKHIQFLLLSISMMLAFSARAQFTEADTIRGMLSPERSCYDVRFYDLHLKIYPDKQFIEGKTDIHFDILSNSDRLQVDLFDNMEIDRIEMNGREVAYERKYHAVFIHAPVDVRQKKGKLTIAYHGKPITAKNAPWDGGFVWEKDKNGEHFIGVACEGTGASLWWPNKDHLSDEPDSMAMHFTVPDHLYCVGNGTLRGKSVADGWATFDWFVHYPINNYNVSVNIADYANFTDYYYSEDGDSLHLDYYVLKDNLKKAQEHFQQVKRVLRAYEHYFGKYPFWEDGFCLVETPYLGMEHQSAIAYGNQYQKGYLGRVTMRGLDWDYIIVHETGHEYWGNAISVPDHGEMWLHESFTTYLESLFVEYEKGKEEAIEYLISQKPFIMNLKPIVGPADVNYDDFGSSDHYFKGAWVLHTFRNALLSDSLFIQIMRSFYDTYKYKVVDTRAWLSHVKNSTGRDFTPFFNQYLYKADIPVLEYYLRPKKGKLEVLYRWREGIARDFTIPIKLGNLAEPTIVYPSLDWKVETIKGLSEDDFDIARELALIKVYSVSQP